MKMIVGVFIILTCSKLKPLQITSDGIEIRQNSYILSYCRVSRNSMQILMKIVKNKSIYILRVIKNITN